VRRHRFGRSGSADPAASAGLTMRKALLLACCLLSGCANLDKEARSDDAQCATHGMHPDSTYYLQCRAQLGAARVQTKPGQIRCQVGPDCDEKWARANKWVTDDLGLKIQTKTDVLIKTVQSPQDTRMLVVTITKNTTWQSGVNEIDFVGNCSSILSCIPSVAESRVRFASFLLAPE
jgi:hypothetical protein